MMRRTLTARIVAAGLSLAFPFVQTAASPSPPLASLSGRVLTSDSRLPVAGVRVQLADPTSGTVHSSKLTTDDGSFKLEGVPAARYNMAVQKGEGVYVVDGSIRLSPGETRNAQVAINDDAAPKPEDARRARGKGRTNWWNNPLTATGLVLGAAIVIGVTVDQLSSDDEQTINSPSAPPTR